MADKQTISKVLLSESGYNGLKVNSGQIYEELKRAVRHDVERDLLG